MYPTSIWPNVTHRMGLEEFKERYPIDGPWTSDETTRGYDEKLPINMERAVDYASQYGVDVFCINWYRDEFQNYAVENLKRTSTGFKISNPEKIQWFLQWSNNSNYHSNTVPISDSKQYFYEGIRLAALHMKDQPYYWKLNNKPVFAIYDVSQIDRIINLAAGRPSSYAMAVADKIVAHEAFLKNCHNIVANVLAGDTTGGITGTGNDVLVSQLSATFTPSLYLVIQTGDVGAWAGCVTVDAMCNYNIRRGTFNGTERRAASFDEIIVAAQQQYDLYVPAVKKYLPKRVNWWPTLMAGYDDRPWFGADSQAQQCPATDAQFQAHVTQVNNVHNANLAATGGITFIYAWNEWGEGGWIAPSGTEAPFKKLEILRDYLKAAPSTSAT
ncbi:glycoside hydrolase family 99-like domain-containing protein [Oxalobacteraceae bacterium A2-2]